MTRQVMAVVLSLSFTLLALIPTAYASDMSAPSGATLSPSSSKGGSADSASDYPYQLSFGNMRLSFGPQSEGGVGSTLKGAIDNEMKNFHTSDNGVLYGVLSYDIDGGWNSSKGALNNITVGFKPSIGYIFTGKENSGVQEVGAIPADTTLKDPKNPSDDEIAKQIKEGNIPSIPLHSIIGLTVYPELEYRFGEFKVSGSTYSANQAIIGGGVRLFYPARVGESGLHFYNWPTLSATYYAVRSSSASDIPLPQGIQDHYLDVEGKVENYLPINLHGHGKLRTLVDLIGSHPTTGVSQGWQVSREFQLTYLVSDKSSVNPVITYRSGANKGLTYDQQIIIGIVTDLVNFPELSGI